jgi:hypothetical protein
MGYHLFFVFQCRVTYLYVHSLSVTDIGQPFLYAKIGQDVAAHRY